MNERVGVANCVAIVPREGLYGLLVGFLVLITLSRRATASPHNTVGEIDETAVIILDVKMGRHVARSIRDEDVKQEDQDSCATN